MKKMMRKTVLVCLVIIMAMQLTGCATADKVKTMLPFGNASEIMNTLEEFEYACRNADVDAALNCINPSIADPIRMGMALFSGLAGVDSEDMTDELIQTVFSSAEMDASVDGSSFLESLEISNPRIKTEKNTAVVDCRINFVISNEPLSCAAKFNMIKKNKIWYINDCNVFSNEQQ